LKIIELPLNLSVEEIEKKLIGYTYLQSYPLKYKNEEGFVEVIRYFVIEETKKAKK
jgi:hypothetical protein